MPNTTPLTADGLRTLLGPPADTWPAQGLTVTLDPDHDDQVHVHDADGNLIGSTRTEHFPHLGKSLRVYCAVIAQLPDGTPWEVGFPGGFLPADPVHALRSEQQRWLPKPSGSSE